MNFTSKNTAALAVLSLMLLTVWLPAPARAGEGDADMEQIGRGAKAWGENCARCHNARDPRSLKDYEWDVSVMHMRKIANLPGEMARDIAAYLKASND